MHPAVRRRWPRPSSPRRPSSRASRSSRGCRARPLPARHGAARRRVDHLHLDVGVHPADGADALLERVVARRSASTRATSPSSRSRWSPPPCASSRDALLHHLDRARRARHDPGAQRRRGRAPRSAVERQLRDEHRRARRRALVQRSACDRVAAWPPARRRRAGITMRGAVRGAREVAEHHAEAVVEGHRDAHPVAPRCSGSPRPTKKPLLRMLWWLSVAPFGKPVVPLVYWMLIGSSSVERAPRASPVPRRSTPSPPARSSSQSDVPRNTTCSSVGQLGSYRRRPSST